MSDPALVLDDVARPPAHTPAGGRARLALIKRLADVVSLPGSRVNAFERAMTADLLVEMLRDAAPSERARVARRMAALSEAPGSVLRLMLRDGVEIARPLLLDAALSDADLIACVAETGAAHRRLIAQRRAVSEVVSDALIATGDAQVIDALLKNAGARLSTQGVELITASSRTHASLIPELLRRPELRPAHAYVLFWWAGVPERRAILTRFAVSREVLQEAASDVFRMAADEGWGDPLVRKALQFIERRQRNRAAVEKSPYANLEEAVMAAQDGLNRPLAEEISYLSGLKPMTGAKIFTDPGGEPLAILCKATGLPRAAVLALWRGLKRPEQDAAGDTAPALARVLEIFDGMAVDRAQTVLRYWNWALSSALTPALVRAIREGDAEALDPLQRPATRRHAGARRRFRPLGRDQPPQGLWRRSESCDSKALARPSQLSKCNRRDSKGLRGTPKMLVETGPPTAAHRAHAEMFAYWNARREAGRLPGRAHIHPGDFKRHLPTISLIDVRRGGDRPDYRLRLAGTGLYRVYGGEITGKALDDVYDEPAADYWRAELDKVVSERRPAAGVHSMSWRGAAHLSILWLRLPLASDGRDVDMILGYDAPVGNAGSSASGIRAA